jgi:hypothetical protein
MLPRSFGREGGRELGTRGTWRSSGGGWLLASVLCLGCPGSSVTSVNVTADRTSLSPAETAILVATVIGSGDFDGTVTWSIDGGGTGLVPSGLSASYTAPSVGADSTVVIRATSTEDSLVSGTATLTISVVASVFGGETALTALAVGKRVTDH